ncbi:MAG: TOBE domain-containing protein [Deltaproteobacteria bacterium]|nr:TOBE domain-containing protein [Deltaproteobacteria bacterium]MBI3388521.1 TOBE domain-containing protein [Deltaproteobacteria bacterium]
MELSARNQLKGTVTKVTIGNVMAEVHVQIGGNELVSVITRGSVERLAIKVGDAVTAIVKATEVMLGK